MNGIISVIGTKTIRKFNSLIFCFTNHWRISCIRGMCSYYSHSARVHYSVHCEECHLNAAHKFKGRPSIDLWMPLNVKASVNTWRYRTCLGGPLGGYETTDIKNKNFPNY